jgi:hypothetical protein
MIIQTPDSTAFCWLHYDNHLRRLTVGFRDRTCHLYRDVPERVFETLITAPSRGRYFNLEIRARYPAEKVEVSGNPELPPFD